jgi:DNA topoisomerase II
LPLNSWTDNYKEYLDKLTLETDFIKTFRDNSNKTDIIFSVVLTNPKLFEQHKKQKFDNNIDGVEKIFSLATSINMNNMHLYNKYNKIQKYNTELEILEEFYNVRLEFYKKRKDLLLKNILAELKILKAKIKFIKLIVDNNIQIFNKNKIEVEKILDNNKLPMNDGNYDYLIKLPIYVLTREKINELQLNHNNKEKQYNLLLKKSTKDMWIDDLNELLKEL